MTESARPLYWHQGLFLQPQHLQLLDLHVQSLPLPLQRFQKPYFWGVIRLQVQESALQSRTFAASLIEVLFQDGTWVSCPGNGVVQAMSFKDVPFDFEGGKPLTVYLGLRKWNPGDRNVTSVSGTEDLNTLGTRFICPIDPEVVRDLHHTGPEARVRLMRYVLRFFWETEIEGLGDSLLIPIARLQLEGKEITLSRDYIPPALTLSASEALVQVLRDIREQVTSRCRVLEMYKLSREARTHEFEGAFLRYLLALGSLNRYIPLLYHLTDAPVAHPWDVFGLLRQLIGELSTYTERIDALARLTDGTSLLPDYDHENLAVCYSEAQVLIGELLSAIILGEENVVHLVREGSRFQGHIPEDRFTDRDIYCLVVRTPGDRTEVLDMFGRIVKVGSAEEMSALLARALPGVPLEHRTAPLPGIPRRPDSYYFMMDKIHPQWQAVRKTGNLCVYWDQAPEETTAELVILRV
jgi:type VI secretion system protein ImpJ